MKDDTAPFWITLFVVFLPVILVVGAIVLVARGIETIGAAIGVAVAARKAAKEAQATEQHSRQFKADLGSVWLVPDGREIFTPGELLAGRVYAITTCGQFFLSHGEDDSGNPLWAAADPLYRTDRFKNFTEPHDCLLLDGKPVPRTQYHTRHLDRDAHLYRFHIDGTGRKLSIALRARSSFLGGVFVKVDLLPEGTPSPEAQPLEEARRAAAEAHQAELRRKVASLLLIAEPLRNWADQEFIKGVAKAQGEQLLRQRAEIAGAHIALHAKEPEVIEILRREHPHEYACLTGRLPAYLIAERESVKPPPRRRRPTTQEVQQLIARREATVQEDERVVLEAAGTGYDNKVQMLRDKGMEEDEVEAVLGQRSDVMAAARYRLQARKEGGNGSLTKLG